jgi:hypothetical protein
MQLPLIEINTTTTIATTSINHSSDSSDENTGKINGRHVSAMTRNQKTAGRN